MVREKPLKMSAGIHGEALAEADAFYSEHGHCETVEKIHAVIDERCKK